MMTGESFTLELQQLEDGLDPFTVQRAIGYAFGAWSWLDRSMMSQTRGPKIRVTSASMNGHPYRMTAISKNPESRVASHLVRGVRQIEEVGTTPPHFTKKILEDLRSLAAMIGTKAGAIVLETDSENARPTTQLLANIDVLLGRDGRAYYEHTSFIGTLDRLDLRDSNKFEVFEPLVGRGVSCAFPSNLLSKVRKCIPDSRPLNRIEVWGRAYFNSRGEMISMAVENFDPVPHDSELPQYKDIAGTDISNGLGSIEYVKSIRFED